MPGFPRDELEEMMRRWVAANDEAGSTGDWSKMPDFYTEDAVYSWNTGPNWDFVATGRQEIAEWAFGTEMSGLEKWTYPYVRTLIDDRKGEAIRHYESALALDPGLTATRTRLAALRSAR